MIRLNQRLLISFLTLSCLLCLPAFHVVGQTDDLYDLDEIVDIEVTIEDEHWHKKLITHKENYEKKRVEGTVVVNGEKFAGAGIRFK
ncbi:MAG: hypothetical protein AAFU03_15040, partial [Bacteroidota bacterium]